MLVWGIIVPIIISIYIVQGQVLLIQGIIVQISLILDRRIFGHRICFTKITLNHFDCAPVHCSCSIIEFNQLRTTRQYDVGYNFHDSDAGDNFDDDDNFSDDDDFGDDDINHQPAQPMGSEYAAPS